MNIDIEVFLLVCLNTVMLLCGHKNEMKRHRKIHYEGLHNVYSWPNLVTMTKSRRMGWAGLVA
jgi:hypothetical protein